MRSASAAIKFLVSLYFYDDLITGYLTVPLWRLEPYAVKVARTVLIWTPSANQQKTK